MTTNLTCRVGVAQRKITPPLGSELGGYPYKRFATEVKSDLYAKVMIIKTNSSCIAIVNNDLLCAYPEFANPAREQIAKTCGIAPEAILISATHTHTGPATHKYKGNSVDPIPGYNEIITTAIKQAAQEACSTLFEATLHFGQADAPGYSINKLSRTKSGQDVYRQPKPNDQEIIGSSGPLDTSVQVLCIRDSDQCLRALVVNFAAHPNSSGEAIWAEWPGEMARVLTAIYGNNALCFFLQGTAGDVDCKKGLSKERIGRGIAGAAIMAIERESAPITSDPIDFRMQKIKISRLAKTLETDRMIEAIHNKPNANSLEKVWPLLYDAWDPKPTELDVPVHCLRIGDTAIVGLPGEAFTSLGLEIKRYSPARHTMVVAYANDHVGYIPPVDQAGRGGYGEWPFMTRHLIPEAATMMTNAAIETLHDMWRRF